MDVRNIALAILVLVVVFLSYMNYSLKRESREIFEIMACHSLYTDLILIKQLHGNATEDQKYQNASVLASSIIELSSDFRGNIDYHYRTILEQHHVSEEYSILDRYLELLHESPQEFGLKPEDVPDAGM